MSQAPHCHNESELHRGPDTSVVAPDSGVFSFQGDPVRIHDCNTSNASKAKRRKTKKELNNAKFKSHTEIFKKKTFPRGVLQKNSMLRKMVSQSGTKDTSNSWRVFITENRLTHHQGIFNREIKSVDIGRLVNKGVDPSKTGTACCPVEPIRKTPQSQVNLSLGLMPTPESKNQDVHSPQKEPSPEIPAHMSDPASCNQQEKEIEKCQSCPQSDGHADPGSGIATSPCRNQPTPIVETAESIVEMLNTHSLFPGRNLMNETRQAILEKVKHQHDTDPTPVQGKPEYNQIGTDDGWKRGGKGGTDISKTVPRTQRTGRPIQTPPIWFLPFPMDSPAHTLIKMVSPEDHPKLKDTVHQPIRYGSDCNPSPQYQQISSQIPHTTLNINSSSHDPKIIRQDRKASSFCRVRRAGKMTSSPANAYSPQVRWRLASDLPTDPSYTHDVPSHNIRHMQEHRTALEDMSTEALNPSRGRLKQQFTDYNKTSSDVFWGSRDQRSPATKILNISPAAIRKQSPTRRYLESYFRRPHSFFLQTPVTGTSCQGVSPLDSFGKLGRETKRHVSPWQDADIGRFATNTMPKQRHWHESRCHNWWNPPSLLREEPKHMENDGDVEWIHRKHWPHVEHHSQQRNIYVALSPQSIQQEPSSVPFPNEKSSRKVLIRRSSPDTWVYPRMKLY